MIAAACRDLECLRFAYRARDGTESRRQVEPHAIVNHGRRWYLVAWDRAREDWRTFRVDRLERPAPMGTRFTARRLPGRDAAAYVKQSIAGRPTASRRESRCTSRREMQGRLSPHWGTLTPIDARSCEYRAGEDDLHWLAIRIAMLGVACEVHEPPELVEELRELAARLDAASRTA